MNQFLDSLNERQREAVETTEGPLLIIAGAGSGKTRVITVRIAYLVSERHVAPHNILAVTFTNKAARLLRKREDVRAHYNERFRYILVDEYQDTNSLQFALIHFLTERQQNICVVGDPDQSIYAWRGADISNILNFEQHYPEARVIKLEQNYRSTQNILDTADAVIKFNAARKEKRLWTSSPAGSPIRYYQAMDAEGEARFAAAKIEEHRRADPTTRAAVLYRTNAQSRLFEEAMRRAGLPYNIVGGFSFYERAEVRDIVAYLKLALNPHDSVALMRVINTPTRGLGKQTLDELDRPANDYGA